MILAAAFDLLRELESRGVEVISRNGEVLFRPQSRVTPVLADRITQEKPALIVLLTNPGRVAPGAWELLRSSVPFAARTGDRPTICASCSSPTWWRRVGGGPWICARCHPTPDWIAAETWSSAGGAS